MTGSTTTSIGEAAHRYAGAVFDLARDTGEIDAVEAGLVALARTIDSDLTLQRTLRSPLFKAEDKAAVLAVLSERLGLPDLARRFVGVVAMNRRAGELSGVAKAFAERAARHRGATRVVARVAQPITADQTLELESTVSRSLGRTVSVDVEIEPRLIGGIQLQIGSRLIDASIRTKLNALTNLMKGA
ncbi:MAG: ATP synthase F1 subunit delta [Alphaproteobacteria bacterium]|nr:ATP synthase F1 subunit delta [Alphaproteobacteria bacterium]